MLFHVNISNKLANVQLTIIPYNISKAANIRLTIILCNPKAKVSINLANISLMIIFHKAVVLTVSQLVKLILMYIQGCQGP